MVSSYITVGNLIEKLKEYPDNLIVMVIDSNTRYKTNLLPIIVRSVNYIYLEVNYPNFTND